MEMEPTIVGAHIDTWINNVKGTLRDSLGEQLDALKQAAQDLEDDVATPWTFVGETLLLKPHGSGRQWRWILHCPSLHLDIGTGKLNGIVGKARLSSAFLWQYDPGDALPLLFDFLADFYGTSFTLQVSEVHLCADIAGWDLSLADATAFISRGHNRKTYLGESDMGDGERDPRSYKLPTLEVNMDGRRCTGYEFSKGAAHSCCIYDKTTEITRSRKDWMKEVWEQHGWDGTSRVIRVEFRYKRECLRELGVEEAYDFLDQMPGLWAYSSLQWLRHTIPTDDTNRGRWLTSPFWQAIQQADFFGEGIPAIREHKHAGDLTLICQMLAGCSTTAAAYMAGQLPDWDDGANFLSWFYDWMQNYLTEREGTFARVRAEKQMRLGIVPLVTCGQVAA
jgi:hypothetical protein